GGGCTVLAGRVGRRASGGAGTQSYSRFRSARSTGGAAGVAWPAGLAVDGVASRKYACAAGRDGRLALVCRGACRYGPHHDGVPSFSLEGGVRVRATHA